jgi:hypothetical protein
MWKFFFKHVLFNFVTSKGENIVNERFSPIAPTPAPVPVVDRNWLNPFTWRGTAAAPPAVEGPSPNPWDVRYYLPTINPANVVSNVARVAFTGGTIPIVAAVATAAVCYFGKKPILQPRIDNASTTTTRNVGNPNIRNANQGNSIGPTTNNPTITNSPTITNNPTFHVDNGPLLGFAQAIKESEIALITRTNFSNQNFEEKFDYIKRQLIDLNKTLTTNASLSSVNRYYRSSLVLSVDSFQDPSRDRENILFLMRKALRPTTMDGCSVDEIENLYQAISYMKTCVYEDLNAKFSKQNVAYQESLSQVLSDGVFGYANRTNLETSTKLVIFEKAILSDPYPFDFRFLQFSAINQTKDELRTVLNIYGKDRENSVRNVQDHKSKSTAYFVFDKGYYKGSFFNYHDGDKLMKGRFLKFPKKNVNINIDLLLENTARAKAADNPFNSGEASSSSVND